jgi:hypothetical protein
MANSDTIEIVVAKWSGPAVKAKKDLDEWIAKTGWDGKLVVHDHDTADLVQKDPELPPVFQGWGECRLNGGPWLRVSVLLESLTPVE